MAFYAFIGRVTYSAVKPTSLEAILQMLHLEKCAVVLIVSKVYLKNDNSKII